MTDTDITKDNTIYSNTFALLYNKPVMTANTLSTTTQPEIHSYKFVAHELSFTEFKNIFYSDDIGIYNMNEIYKNTPYLHFDKQKVSSRYFDILLILPPVMDSSPVSMRVTFQGSALFL